MSDLITGPIIYFERHILFMYVCLRTVDGMAGKPDRTGTRRAANGIHVHDEPIVRSDVSGYLAIVYVIIVFRGYIGPSWFSLNLLSIFSENTRSYDATVVSGDQSAVHGWCVCSRRFSIFSIVLSPNDGPIN